MLATIFPLGLALLASASPLRLASFTLSNGQAAQALNREFATLSINSPCNASDIACINGDFAQCVFGNWSATACSPGLTCGAAPLVNSAGTSVICDTIPDFLARIAATGATGGLTGNDTTATASSVVASVASTSTFEPIVSPSVSATSTSVVTTSVPAVMATATPVVDNGVGAPQTVITIFITSTIFASPSSASATPSMAASPSPPPSVVSSLIAAPLAASSSPPSVASSLVTSAPAAPSPSLSSSGNLLGPPACYANTTTSTTSSRRSLSARISQDLPQIVQPWQTACEASGGDIVTNDPCVNLAGGAGLNALLAGADPCAQQEIADQMIDFAYSANITNQATLISIAKTYRTNPRNALNINGIVPSTPFCEQAPRHSELVGLANGQLDGVDRGVFGGPNFTEIVFGTNGTCPFGTTPDVNTCTCN